MRMGIIDVGSNAIRMVLGESDSSSSINYVKTLREPVRLGADSFSKGHISEEKAKQLVAALKRFKLDFSNFNVNSYKAVATSAMREASNGHQIIERVLKEADIKLELIDGKEESRLIHLAVVKELELEDQEMVIIDIGGGSVEVIAARGMEILESTTLKMGTLRLLSKCNDERFQRECIEKEIQEMIPRLKNHKKVVSRFSTKALMIGTGGNARALDRFGMNYFMKKKKGQIKSYDLEMMLDRMLMFNGEQRVKEFGMREDRADVIVPAGLVFLQMMSYFDFMKMRTPNVGLKNGLMWSIRFQASE